MVTYARWAERSSRATFEHVAEGVRPVSSAPGKPAPPADRVYDIFEEVRIGDVGVKVTKMTTGTYLSDTPFGRTLTHPPAFQAVIEITNHNPAKVVEIRSQGGSPFVGLKDSAGNKYGPLTPQDDFGNENRVRGRMKDHTRASLRTGEPLYDVVICERPAPAAAGVILILDAACYGGTGVIRVRVD